MKLTAFASRIFILLSISLLSAPNVFCGSPQLVWYKTYGEPALNQQALVIAIDNFDNTFVAGYVNFGGSGNIILNRYDGVGNMKWNRLYSNNLAISANDIPVALFPDNQAGVTLVGYINGPAIITHIIAYSGSNGNITSDITVGNTSAGSKTFPFAVLYDGASSYYMIGQLNSVSKVFKCDNTGNIIWSVPLNNDFNNQVGSFSFDNYGSVVAVVTDSATSQVIIHRFDQYSGYELPVINTHISNLPVNANYIHATVDLNSNMFLAALGTDTAGRTQWVVDKFDTTGALLWSTMCNSSKGHSNIVNSFMLDHYGDIVISGPFTDNTDTLQYAAVYKISGDTGGVVWSTIDSQFLVNEAVVQIDLYSNVYLASTKTPSTISPFHSDFSCSLLNPDSGIVQWNRSFDNSSDNTGLIMQVNNFGDLFLATTTPTDTGAEWFVGRIGNAAGDVLGTAVKNIPDATDEISVFPNPFTSSTNIRFTSSESVKLTLKLYDAQGRLLQEQMLQAVAGDNVVTMNTAVSKGAYLLKLEGGQTNLIKPVVIY